jgi:serine/threonine protein kinase
MILNETVATKPDWISLHGKTLEGGYELGAVLEASDTVAYLRVRVLGYSNVAAYASFYLADGAVAAEQLQVWQDLRNLKHPNLKSPLACGRLKVSGSSFIYVICAMPDETLSEILGDRGLTDEEGRELLKSLGTGLLYLHSHGFAHGALSPEMAVAVGESIQISTECTRRINTIPKIEVATPRYLAPEVKTTNSSMSADIWCLGATVFEALVQKKYESTWFGDLERLPLGPTLQRCLDSNPHTRARLSELIEPPNDGRAEATQVPPSARVKPVKVARQPIEAKKIRPLDPTNMELVKFDSAYGLERLKVRVKSDKGGAWRPIMAGVAALILLAVVIWLVILPKLRSVSETAAADQNQQQPSSAWPTKTISASPSGTATSTPSDPSVAQAASSSTAASQTPGLSTSSANNWRFVIGDYKQEQDADRRIENINKIHPELNAHKFSKNPDGPFYVVSGEPMSKDDANELRKKALQMGIARTSYVSDFSN